MHKLFALSALALCALPALALDQSQAASGVKEALADGVTSAIKQLGKPDGFLGDQAVRIAVPQQLQSVAKTARKLGQGKYVDELETSMNHAAEKAVPAAADVFGAAIKQMSVSDALGIVQGGDDAATQYFRKTSGDALRDKMLPIVKQETAATGVTSAYKNLTEKGGGALGKFGGGDKLDIDRYVTDKALDGLFHYIGQQEAAIRKNPVATGSALLKSVFGH